MKLGWKSSIVVLGILSSMVGCTPHISVSGSKNLKEAAAEASYGATWAKNWQGLSAVNEDLVACNTGGSLEGCVSASNAAIAALDRFLIDLKAIAVPARYAKANAGVGTALETLKNGYSSRNEAIAAGSDEGFVAGNELLRRGNLLLKDAYQDFPEDSRPQPPA